MSYTTPEPCHRCDGSGVSVDGWGGRIRCPQCDGNGSMKECGCGMQMPAHWSCDECEPKLSLEDLVEQETKT